MALWRKTPSPPEQQAPLPPIKDLSAKRTRKNPTPREGDKGDGEGLPEREGHRCVAVSHAPAPGTRHAWRWNGGVA